MLCKVRDERRPGPDTEACMETELCLARAGKEVISLLFSDDHRLVL